MDNIDRPIRIGSWFQGPTGSGQGGWTAHRLVQRVGAPSTVAITAPIPLDTDLDVVAPASDAHDDVWKLIDPTGDQPVVVMTAEPHDVSIPSTPAITIGAAKAARDKFERPGELHPVPYCFSCGLQHDSMNVHAGPLGDGRYATDWRVPDWATDDEGTVDDGVLWAALDCTAAWYIACTRGDRTAVTAQFDLAINAPLHPGGQYALVSWWGDASREWNGRKRFAASAAFAHDGTCVARSRSFWIAIDPT